jgi:glycosyltransferase 2 family protein
VRGVEAHSIGHRRTLRLGIKWLIPVAIIATLVLTGHLGEAFSALSDVSIAWSIPLILIGVGLPISHAWRWCYLLKRTEAEIPLTTSARITSLASLINYAAPGFLGAPVKAILARDSHRVPLSKSLPTLVIEQLLDALMLAFAAGIAVILAGPILIDWAGGFLTAEDTLIVTGIVLAAGIGLVLLWLIGRRLFPKFVDSVQTATSTLLRSKQYLGPIAALTATRWILDMLAFAVASVAVGLRLSLVEILLIANLSLLIGLIAPVPGGLGVREAMMATIAGVIGVSIPAVLALSVLHRAGLAFGLPLVLAGARLREWSSP